MLLVSRCSVFLAHRVSGRGTPSALSVSTMPQSGVPSVVTDSSQVLVPNGENSPDAPTQTDYGSLDILSPAVSHKFRIVNSAAYGQLVVLGVSLGGADAAQFSISFGGPATI